MFKKDPDKMSQQELRNEVKSLRTRIQAGHDAAQQIGYDKGFQAGGLSERSRITDIIKETGK